MKQRVRIFAPATIANLGPGFDVLGLALSAPGDVVEAELADRPGVEIVEITGDNGALSKDPVRNVAGSAAAEVLQQYHSGTCGASRAYRVSGSRSGPCAVTAEIDQQ